MQHRPAASSEPAQQAPVTSTDLAVPSHTPQASTVPEAQQAPALSSVAPAGQQAPAESSRPEAQQVLLASMTWDLQVMGTCDTWWRAAVVSKGSEKG